MINKIISVTHKTTPHQHHLTQATTQTTRLDLSSRPREEEPFVDQPCNMDTVLTETSSAAYALSNAAQACQAWNGQIYASDLSTITHALSRLAENISAFTTLIDSWLTTHVDPSALYHIHDGEVSQEINNIQHLITNANSHAHTAHEHLFAAFETCSHLDDINCPSW